jgi:uncharacterized protein (UPF0332 family)
LALEHRFETSKHNQLIGWFNKKFILTGNILPKYGRILKNAYRNRTKGDYDAFISFEMEEVSQMYLEMIDFIETIESLVENHRTT